MLRTIVYGFSTAIAVGSSANERAIERQGGSKRQIKCIRAAAAPAGAARPSLLAVKATVAMTARGTAAVVAARKRTGWPLARW
jgi:hypothetical protein